MQYAFRLLNIKFHQFSFCLVRLNDKKTLLLLWKWECPYPQDYALNNGKFEVILKIEGVTKRGTQHRRSLTIRG